MQKMTPANQLLLLLAVLPCCWSLCDISAARRYAHHSQCEKVIRPCKKSEDVAKRAADQAGVVFDRLVEAYKGKAIADDGYKVCLLFSAWSNECYGSFQHCVASKSSEGAIDVECVGVWHVGGRYKSGDFSFIPDDVDGPLRVARLPINSTTRNFLVVGVQCRGKDILPAELQPFCASFVHPDRPGWYYIARNGLLVPEPEYDPTDPETFDLEASLIFHPEYYFTGFFTFEYASQPGYKVIAASDGFVRLAQDDGTLEFKNRASSRLIRDDTKELFPCSSCDEIKAKKPDACSGDFVIMLADGMLEQVHCDI